MHFLKTVVFLLLLIPQMHVVHAEWNPLYLPADSIHNLNILKDPKLTALETKVCQYIRNSWCSEEKAKLLIELIALTRSKICVEIGVFSGSSTLPMLAALQYQRAGKAYAIDAWSNSEAVAGLPDHDPNTQWWKSLRMQDIKNHFGSMIRHWGFDYYCETLSMTSQAASSKISQIDLLHLDGNFSEPGALRDSEQYVPKVVPGGYILISNVLVMIDGKATKMKALRPLFEQCDIICELDHGNTLLFRKKLISIGG